MHCLCNIFLKIIDEFYNLILLKKKIFKLLREDDSVEVQRKERMQDMALEDN
jgi:hypothetical protein